jgi:hypothetical protein
VPQFAFYFLCPKLRPVALSIGCANISKLKFPDILVVAAGCHEPAGSLNPPPGLYHVTKVYCNESTNDIDARESGIILHFVIENYQEIRERKVFFIHNHDRAWHLPQGSIWEHIDSAVKAPTFWTKDFGDVGSILSNHFPPGLPDYSWFQKVDIVPWLFRGTSMTEWVGKSWDMPCCATFWLNSERMWLRPKRDYVRLLANINTLVKAGFCQIFNWTICNDHAFMQKLGSDLSRDNFLLGQIMEVLWGVILANQSWTK